MTVGFRPRRDSQAESSLVAALFIEWWVNNAVRFIKQEAKIDPSKAIRRAGVTLKVADRVPHRRDGIDAMARIDCGAGRLPRYRSAMRSLLVALALFAPSIVSTSC
jgi:hypothetical protein